MEYTLQAIKYNNYYNRQLKIADNYVEIDPNPYWEEGIYFNFSDGVNTTQVVDDLVEDKDYCILYELGGLASLHSRWFIIDAEYQLNGQTVLTLRRDLLADFAPQILYANAFIEKGWLQANNNLIFNTEQMTFNQVKKEELLLKDSTNIPWIVGYYSDPKEGTISGSASLPNTEYDFAIDVNYADWVYAGAHTVTPLKDTVQYKFEIWSSKVTEYTLRNGVNGDVVNTVNKGNAGKNYLRLTPNTSVNEIQRGLWHGLHREDYYKYLLQEDGVSNITAQELLDFNNKVIKFANNEVYKISVYHVDGENRTAYANIGKNLSTKMLSDMQSIFTGKTLDISNSNIPWLEYSYQAQIYNVHGEKVSTGTYTYSISKTHYTLSDAPYSMFCMPYGALTVTEGSTSIITDKDIQLLVATEMAKADGQIYDIQILPYCPLADIKSQSYTVTDNRAYDVIKEGDKTVGYIFHCQRASFTKKLSILPVPSWLEKKSDPVDVKVQNECEFIRFNSPNYASSWEMSVAKNEGIFGINVSATYKPFSPYIKVYPDFKGLYGNDFNDQRGLILSGDFSIPVVNDQWKTYELQNKNYQNIFDREIRNLEVQQKFGRMSDIIGAATGAIGAAGTGMALGAAGGPIGMAAGAIGGGLLSAGAGIADVYINDQLRDEAKSYKQDMYGFQLGNIKALPNTLSKTSAYNVDNKYFPFIEYYSATDVEIEAFRNKLKYNGMTVGVIGKFADYLSDGETYVKGQLIRLEGIGDMHMVNQIAAEMEKGVYIDGSITAGI